MAKDAEFSDSLLSAVEGAQRLDHIPVIKYGWRLGRWAIHGYSEPRFHYALFATARCISEVAEFSELSANPDAGPIPRLWGKIALLSINEGALRQTEAPLKSEGIEAYHAVAYRQAAGTPVHTGILQGEAYEGFGRIERMNGINARGAGVRQGGGPTEIALGLWLPGSRAMVVPPGAEMPMQLLPKEYFTRAYPQLPIV